MTISAPIPDRTERRNRNLRFLFLSCLVFCAVFAGMVAGALLVIHLDPRNVHPPETEQLARLKDQVVKNPDNTQLKDLFNSLDQSNRSYLLARDRRVTSGGFFLAGGLVGLVVFALLYNRMDPRRLVMKRPGDEARSDSWFTLRRRNVVAVAIGAVVILIAFIVTAGFPRLNLPESKSPLYHETWPGFRGPDGLGVAPPGDWATSWDLANGTNILWETEVPLAGKSSPVVWGDRLFLTGATASLQQLFCFDRSSGKLLWRTSISSPESRAWARAGEYEQVNFIEDTGSAAPSPATDGKLVFVVFYTNDVAAVDFSGKVKWVKNFGKPESSYGLASSPLVHQDTLVYQCDQGIPDEALSAIYGLDKDSGNVIWRKERPVGSSWGSPILARQAPAGVQIITTASPWVIAYDPEFGDELWRANVLPNAEVGSSPAYADGIAYVTDDEAQLSAIRTDGRGDVTDTHVLWHSDEGRPDASSPVCDGKFLIQADSVGTVTCFDAGMGKLLWKHDFKTGFWSSPIISGNLVFVVDRKGDCFILDLGDAYKEIGTGRLDEPTDATPAFADSVIYVRTQKHLVAIAKGRQK